jgi:hypothetical protein
MLEEAVRGGRVTVAQGAPVPGRGHLPGGVAVPALLAQLREIEELMLDRGVIVSYETIRRWCAQFGQTYDDALRRRQPGPGDKWHLDEVFLKVDRRSAGARGGPGTGRSGVVRLMRVRGED